MSLKIEQLTAPQFQGRNLNLKLSAVNLIVGANAEGKTAITNAVRVLLYGQVPRLGKTEAATFQLSSDPLRLCVQGKFSNDTVGECIVTRSESGSCSRNFNPAFETPMVLLDPQEYFNKTEAERMRYVFERVDLTRAGYDEPGLLAELATVEALPAKVAEPLVKKWREEVNLSIVRRKQIKQTVQEWIAMLTDRMKQNVKACHNLTKQHNATVTALRPVGPLPENVTLAYAKASNDLSELTGKLGAARRDLELATPNPVDLKRLREFMAQGEKREKEIGRLKGEILKAKKELARYKPVDQEKLQATLDSVNRRCAAKEQEVATLARDLTALIKESDKMQRATCCPVCEAAGKGWLKAWSDKTAKIIHAKDAQEKKDRAEVSALVKERNTSKAALEQAQADERVNDELELRLGEMVTASEAQEVQRRAEPQAKKELARLEALDPKLAKALVTRLESEHAMLTTTTNQLKTKNDAWTHYQQNKEKRETAEQASLLASCEASVIQSMMDLIMEAQERVVNGAFNALLATARKLTNGLIRSPLEYREGEMGRHVVQADLDAGLKQATVGSWIPHKMFSGWERTLAYVGLSVALCQTSPIKLAIIDDLIISTDNKERLLSRMRELAQSGDLDQVFIVDSETSGWVARGQKAPSWLNIITVA